MPWLVDRYVFREMVAPFLVGLVLVTFVLLMNQVLLLAELFIDKSVPALEALRILGLLIPSILVFSLPMAVLMGALGGLARLAADSEIVAFQSVGMGPWRLARPVLLFGLSGFLLTLPLALALAPRANNAWVRAMTESVLGRVRLKVEPLEFNESLPNVVFMVRDVGRDKSWHDVFAYMGKDPSDPRLVMARSGTVRLFPAMRRAVLELVDGTVYSGPPSQPEKDTVTSFERLEEEIDIQGLFAAASSEKRVREKDIGELVHDLKALESVPPALREERQIRAHQIEIHKKFALPAACLIFALFGLPLGVLTGRAGRTGGFSLGLVIILVYYILLTAGEKAAMDGRLSAFLGMWGPNILMAMPGALLYSRAGRIRSYLQGLAGRWRSASRPKKALRRLAQVSRPGPPRRFQPLPLRFPGILDRYVSSKFLSVLVLALSAFSLAALLVAFFEGLDITLAHGKPIGLLVSYVWFKLPEFLAFLLPVSVLAAALIALGILSRTNEAVAMKASGISAYRTILPVIALAAAASGLAFLVQERVVPAAHARSEAAWGEINDLPPRSYSFLNRHWILGRGGDRIYHFDYFDRGTATFSRLSVYSLDPGRWNLASRFFAGKAVFAEDGLLYREGWIRDFAASSDRPFVRAEGGRLPVSEDRETFSKPWKEPLQMTLGELREYTAEVRGMGFPAVRLRAEIGQRTALPFVCLVMAVLAVPFGFRMGKKGTLVGVGLSLAVAIAYWGTFAIFRSLGAAGVLTPLLGAWGANVLYGLAGTVMLLRLRT